MARVWGNKEIYPERQTGNSGHFYVDRDGSIEQWVPVNRIAHHVRDFNQRSVGIELVNTGRYPDWFLTSSQQLSEPYPNEQITALVDLLQHLKALLPNLRSISGHEDLDTGLIPAENNPDIMIRRKLDPGPCFPWTTLMEKTTLTRQLGKQP